MSNLHISFSIEKDTVEFYRVLSAFFKQRKPAVAPAAPRKVRPQRAEFALFMVNFNFAMCVVFLRSRLLCVSVSFSKAVQSSLAEEWLSRIPFFTACVVA